MCSDHFPVGPVSLSSPQSSTMRVTDLCDGATATPASSLMHFLVDGIGSGEGFAKSSLYLSWASVKAKYRGDQFRKSPHNPGDLS